MAPKQYRQGDVLLIRREISIDDHNRTLTEIPPDEKGRIVLALGEATGHAHAVVTENPAAVMGWTDGDKKLLRLIEKGELQHEEHGSIALAPGDYDVIQQREFDEEAERRERAVYD